MSREDSAQLLDAVRTVIRLARIAQSACDDAGLSLAQYRALNSARVTGRRAFELALTAAVSRPAISSLTNGMVRDGLLAREASAADGRGVVFAITAHGRDRLQAAELLLEARFTEVLGGARAALDALDTISLGTALDAQAAKEFGDS